MSGCQFTLISESYLRSIYAPAFAGIVNEPIGKTYTINLDTFGVTSTSAYFASLGAWTVARYLGHVSQTHQSCVEFLESSYLPVIKGANDELTFLYEFVQEWDAATDYADLQERMPNLTFGQIASAISFLRGVSQFNTRGIDIDALEDDDIESSAAFQEMIQKSLGELTTGRVFDLGNSNS